MTPPRLIRINCNQLGKYLYSPRVRGVSPKRTSKRHRSPFNFFGQNSSAFFSQNTFITKRDLILSQGNSMSTREGGMVIQRRHLKVRHFTSIGNWLRMDGICFDQICAVLEPHSVAPACPGRLMTTLNNESVKRCRTLSPSSASYLKWTEMIIVVSEGWGGADSEPGATAHCIFNWLRWDWC